MDARHFDHLARMVSRVSARRGVLRRLAALPVLAGLAALLDPGESDAAGRRKRRKKRHKHAQKQRKGSRKRKRKCKAKSRAKTCAGTCGIVKNTCRKKIDCGSCACDPPCPVCQICQEALRACGPDPVQQGAPCGEPGQVCQGDGACACSGGSCGACRTCGSDGRCAAPCNGTGCCDGTSCQAGTTDAACGSSGTCAICSGQEVCQNQSCVCVPDCAGKICGSDGCSGTCDPGCPGEQVCQDGVCGFACGGDFCPAATQICDGGSCVACDVCSTCTHTTVQAAVNAASSGDTIRICAGAYTRNGTDPVANIDGKNLTLIGAGAGSGGTILDGQGVLTLSAVLFCLQSTASVRQLTVTGSNGFSGIRVASTATLTLADVTVTGNTTDAGGGIFNFGTATLNAGTSIRGNFGGTDGGGIHNQGSLTLNDGSSVIDNSAPAGGGITNAGGTVTLNDGSSVIDNSAPIGGGIVSTGGTVTLNPGSLVCDNSEPQCSGFTPPSGFCGACP